MWIDDDYTHHPFRVCYHSEFTMQNILIRISISTNESSVGCLDTVEHV